MPMTACIPVNLFCCVLCTWQLLGKKPPDKDFSRESLSRDSKTKKRTKNSKLEKKNNTQKTKLNNNNDDNNQPAQKRINQINKKIFFCVFFCIFIMILFYFSTFSTSRCCFFACVFVFFCAFLLSFCILPSNCSPKLCFEISILSYFVTL